MTDDYDPEAVSEQLLLELAATTADVQANRIAALVIVTILADGEVRQVSLSCAEAIPTVIDVLDEIAEDMSSDECPDCEAPRTLN